MRDEPETIELWSPAFWELPPVLRALLTLDGTVTTFLEAFFRVKLHVERVHDDGDGEKDVRVVRLVDDQGRPWVFAITRIYRDATPFDVLYDLENTELPIGEVLARHRLRTFRNIKRVWRPRAGEFKTVFGGEALVAREYHVLHREAVMLQVREVFPVARFDGEAQR